MSEGMKKIMEELAKEAEHMNEEQAAYLEGLLQGAIEMAKKEKR